MLVVFMSCVLICSFSNTGYNTMSFSLSDERHVPPPSWMNTSPPLFRGEFNHSVYAVCVCACVWQAFVYTQFTHTYLLNFTGMPPPYVRTVDNTRPPTIDDRRASGQAANAHTRGILTHGFYSDADGSKPKCVQKPPEVGVVMGIGGAVSVVANGSWGDLADHRNIPVIPRNIHHDMKSTTHIDLSAEKRLNKWVEQRLHGEFFFLFYVHFTLSQFLFFHTLRPILISSFYNTPQMLFDLIP